MKANTIETKVTPLNVILVPFFLTLELFFPEGEAEIQAIIET